MPNTAVRDDYLTQIPTTFRSADITMALVEIFEDEFKTVLNHILTTGNTALGPYTV